MVQKETTNMSSRVLRVGIPLITTFIFASAIVAGIQLLKKHAESVEPQKQNPPPTVATQTIKFQDSYIVTQFFAGRLEASRETRLAFERGGLVITVMANEGDQVEKGQVVAKLDISKLETRHAELLAQKKELQAQLNLAKATLVRRTDLKKKGWSPSQSYDEARYSVEQLIASIQRIEASIQSVKIDIEKSELKTPFAGTIAARSIDEGAVVNIGTPVLTLLESKKSQIRVGVSVNAAKNLKIRNHYQFRINDRTYSGVLISKRPDLQAGTRTVTALFEFHKKHRFPLGEIAELVLERKIQSSGVWLPITALNEGQKGLWTVYKVVSEKGRHTIRREAVEILHTAADRVFVRGTFQEGDSVVINGVNRIIPGQQVALAN